MVRGEAEVSANPAPRRARRITFLRPVHLRAIGQRGPLKRMFAGNLSRGGMYVRSPSAFAPGTRVEVFLEAKGQVLPFAEAVVVFSLLRDEAMAHQRLPGFGLRFTRMPARSRALVEELLRIVPAGAATPAPQRSASPPREASPPPPATGRARTRRTLLGVALVALIGAATAVAASFPHLAFWLSP